MKLLRTWSLSVGGVVAAVVLLSAVFPHTAQAFAAALVLVTNTTANPAITQSTDKQASQLVRLTSLATLFSGDNCGNHGGVACPPLIQIGSNGFLLNSGNPYVVPAGQNLVITDVMITPFNANSITGPIGVTLDVSPLDNSGNYVTWEVDANHSTEYHPTGLVIGPGISLNTEVTGGGNPFQVIIWMEGYLTAN